MTASPKAPDNTCLYAIGDIHGRVDLLQQLYQKIKDDASQRSASRKVIVYLGDYVDRGMESKEVVDILLNPPLPEFKHYPIRGNHEDAMLNVLAGQMPVASWQIWGGLATLKSYGVTASLDKEGLVVSDFNARVPDTHQTFLHNLPYYHIEGDYLFVHAGLMPEVALEDQSVGDMTMIREECYLSDYDFGKTIVFGHTVFDKPLVRNGRIGIDTGAYASGILTCLVAEGPDFDFITT